MNDDLRPLEALTRMKLDTELARLRRLSEVAEARRREISALGASVEARSRAIAEADPARDLALLSGQDAIWQDWVQRQKRRLTRDAAEAAAQREAQRVRAQRAFGETEALKGLRELAVNDRKAQAVRRSHADPEGTGHPGQ